MKVRLQDAYLQPGLLAARAQAAPAQSVPAGNAAGGGAGLPQPDIAQSESKSAQSRRSHRRTTCGPHAWPIYEVFPLTCPLCVGQMRIIAFITNGAEVRKFLEHIGVDSPGPAHYSGTRAAAVGRL